MDGGCFINEFIREKRAPIVPSTYSSINPIFHAHPSLFPEWNLLFLMIILTRRENERSYVWKHVRIGWNASAAVLIQGWESDSQPLSHPRPCEWDAFLSGLACVNLLYHLYKKKERKKRKITVSTYSLTCSWKWGLHAPFLCSAALKTGRRGFELMYHIEVSWLNKMFE